jgi:DNA invertase Pin-like site-specific DNA recombinase
MFVAYYRVSTARQGQSGLGLAAQKKAVRDYVGDGRILTEFTEVETGRRNDRKAMLSALNECRLTGATLVIAKLDRLSRNAAFLMGLRDSGIDFVACDMPTASRLTVGIMALVAEQEVEAISARTKAALAAAKARGQTLGGFRGVKVDPSLGTAARQKKADDYVLSLGPILEDYEVLGQGVSKVARVMNARGILTPGGGRQWTPMTAFRVVDRYWGLKKKADQTRSSVCPTSESV